MGQTLRVKRGNSTNFASAVLQAGEPCFVLDTGEFYVGDGTKKVLINPEFPVINAEDVVGLGTAATHDVGSAAGTVPVLGGDGKLAESLLPSVALVDVFEVSTQSAMLALSAQKGDVAVRSDLNKSYILKQSPATTLGNWVELRTPTDAVQSVNGMTGAVTVSTITGNAATATTLQTSRTFRTNLASTSTASFNGSANITPGVTGTLGISNGGTGATTAAAARANLGCLGVDDVIDGGSF